MLMWLSSRASQMEVPAGAETSAPWGQYSAWGRILMVGMACCRLLVLQTVSIFLPDERLAGCRGSCAWRRNSRCHWRRARLRSARRATCSVRWPATLGENARLGGIRDRLLCSEQASALSTTRSLAESSPQFTPCCSSTSDRAAVRHHHHPARNHRSSPSPWSAASRRAGWIWKIATAKVVDRVDAF